MTTPKEISRLSELEELRLQNAEYAEQVKRLVRAEAKLYEVQETLDAQSATYRFLAESERKLASSRDVSEILQLALECIVTGARLQRAFILFADEPDAPLTHRYDDGFYAVDEQAQSVAMASPKPKARARPSSSSRAGTRWSRFCLPRAFTY